MKKISSALILFTLLAPGFATAADGDIEVTRLDGVEIEVPKKDENKGYFSATVSIWLPPVEGQATDPSTGVVTDYEADAKRRIEKFKPSGEVSLEYYKNNWFVGVNGQYVNDVDFEASAELPYGLGTIPVDEMLVDNIIVDYYVGKRFGETDKYWIEVLVGGRKLILDIDTRTFLGENNVKNKINMLTVGARYEVSLEDLGLERYFITGSHLVGVDETSDNANLDEMSEHMFGFGRRIGGRTKVTAGIRMGTVDFTHKIRTDYDMKPSPYVKVEYNLR